MRITSQFLADHGEEVICAIHGVRLEAEKDIDEETGFVTYEVQPCTRCLIEHERTLDDE